ncbi:MAG: hypothetical protein GY898_03910 [Proteobacteria bacterium]|nr:hypothetical protein [Pseudomonadota bacterium]
MPTLGQVEPSRVAERWREHARSLADGGPLDGSPAGAPGHEYRRSPAAAATAALADLDGLFLFHYEHCVPLAGAEEWGVDEPPPWSVGVLPEPKYGAFRHDQLCGGFHPGHRAKWSTHELCHGLVGFAWYPGAAPFFHATGGRLAELLPVALYYFFDEAFLQRCPVHAGGGPLFRTYCPACEAAASSPASEHADAERWIADGLRYIDRELAAIERTRRTGAVVPHRWASLDLASDGVAYAEAHGSRLGSDAFAAWIDRFVPAGAGRRETLDALQDRVEAVTLALLGEGPAPAPQGTSDDWVRADLAWRFEVVRAQTEGEANDELDRVLQRLADTGDVAAAGAAYVALDAEFELAPPDELFALGYAVPGLDGGDAAACAYLTEGVASCAPGSLQLAGPDAVAALLSTDRSAPDRAALPVRWARLLDGAPGDLAAYEAALATAGGGAVLAGPGRDGRVRLSPGVRLVRTERDVVELAGAVERGDYDADPPGPSALVVFRADDGDVALVELDPADADALAALPGHGAELAVTSDVLAALVELGVVEPAARSESWTS